MKIKKADLEAMLKDAGDASEVEVKMDAPVEGDIKAEVEKAFKATSSEVKVAIKAELDTAVAGVKSEIEAFMKTQREAKEAKAGAYADEVQAKRAKLNSHLKDFARALLDGDDVKAKEMTTDKEGSPFAGYVVDSELSAEIRHLVTEYGVARREFFSTALSKNSYEANALATDVSVSWVAEAGAIGSTQIVLSQEELKLKKLAAIVALTRELIDDEEVDLFSFIATRVAEALAKAEDKAFFVGEGSGDTTNGEFKGLCFETTIPEVQIATKTALTVEKLYEVMDTLPEGAQAGAKWYMHRTWRSKARLLKDDDGRYVYADPINNAGLATLLGKPVVTVEVMPTYSATGAGDSVILYGDLKKTTILGYKNGISADRFNAGVIRNVAGNADINLITTDRQAIRWVTRVGFITILPTACVRLEVQAGS